MTASATARSGVPPQVAAAARDGARVLRHSQARASAESFRLAFVALLFAAASLASPRAADGQAAPAIADLDWLSGAWVLERTGERLEEWWSTPVGNSMVGHFRWIRDGDLWITEMVSITEEPGEVVFRLRHFSADMRAWEAADDAFTYRLTDRATGRMVFTIVEPRAGRPSRFIYESLPGDSLLVRLEGEEDGRPSTQDFRYARGWRSCSDSVSIAAARTGSLRARMSSTVTRMCWWGTTPVPM